MSARRTKAIFITALALVIVLVAVAIVLKQGWFWAFCSRGPMSLADADLDKSGHVSYLEADYVCNCGARPVTQDGKQCTEYFAAKDGLPLKVVCPSN